VYELPSEVAFEFEKYVGWQGEIVSRVHLGFIWGSSGVHLGFIW
jgi:hypothetical protein